MSDWKITAGERHEPGTGDLHAVLRVEGPDYTKVVSVLMDGPVTGLATALVALAFSLDPEIMKRPSTQRMLLP